MKLANKITLTRVILTLLLVLPMVFDYDYKKYILAGLFVSISLTDILDGYVARKLKQETAFGKVFDQIADKLLVTIALLYILSLHPEFFWMIFLILAREFLVSGYRQVAASYGAVVKAQISGKIKMWLQPIAIIYILLELPYANIILLVVTLYTIFTAFDYFFKIDGMIREKIKSKVGKKRKKK